MPEYAVELIKQTILLSSIARSHKKPLAPKTYARVEIGSNYVPRSNLESRLVDKTYALFLSTGQFTLKIK